MKKILITGGAGFIGSSLAIRLSKEFENIQITCLDNLSRNGSTLNRNRLAKYGIKFKKADVRQTHPFNTLKCDLIIDAAAEPSVLAGVKGHDTKYIVDTNLVGTLNVLELARKQSAGLIFLSSSRVFPIVTLQKLQLRKLKHRFDLSANQKIPGVTKHGISEDFPLHGSRTLYGATKLAAEVMAAEYAAQFGIPIMINRCGVIAGPWQMGRIDQGIVALWVASHAYSLPLSYIGYGGRQVRDILHIEDLSDLVIKQVRDGFKHWTGTAFNVGGGLKNSLSLRELTNISTHVTSNRINITLVDQIRRGDVPFYVTDSRRVQQLFEWTPRRSAAKTIQDTARWIQDYREILAPLFSRKV